MRLYVVRVYQQGRKLSDWEILHAEGVIGGVRMQTVQHGDGRDVREAISIDLTTQWLPRLLEPQLVGISTLALGLEGYEEKQKQDGVVYMRQGWCCRVR
jgi:hypothetical protein